MATLYRPRIVRFVDPQGKRCKKGTPGAKRIATRSQHWYAQFTDADGINQRKPLRVTSKDRAQAILGQLLADVERELAGDPFVKHDRTPLLCDDCQSTGHVGEQACESCREQPAHLTCFRRHLLNQNSSPKHVRQQCQRIVRLFQDCRMTAWRDITAARVDNYLANCRAAGLAVQTSNYYLQAVTQFCNWMVRNKRGAENPLTPLRPLDTDTDRRRERRPAESLDLLVQAARDTCRAKIGQCSI